MTAAAPSCASARSIAGRFLEYRELEVPGLPNQRLTIWLPPSYDADDVRYRVLYMHDAQNLFDPALSNFNKVWAADKAMMDHAGSRQENPWIIVGIWSPGDDRYRQYLPAPAYEAAGSEFRAQMDAYAQGPIVSRAYVNWIATTLKPWLDSELRTLPSRGDTAMIGSSMGGLISLYAFLEYPEVFGRAGCVSTHWPAIAPQSVSETNPELTAFWTTWLHENLGPPDGRKVWFDHGTATLDAFYAPYQAAVDEIMHTSPWIRGTQWQSRVYPGAEHEENAWAERLPEVFDWVLG